MIPFGPEICGNLAAATQRVTLVAAETVRVIRGTTD